MEAGNKNKFRFQLSLSGHSVVSVSSSSLFHVLLKYLWFTDACLSFSAADVKREGMILNIYIFYLDQRQHIREKQDGERESNLLYSCLSIMISY